LRVEEQLHIPQARALHDEGEQTGVMHERSKIIAEQDVRHIPEKRQVG
jgi:hypothetical protein